MFDQNSYLKCIEHKKDREGCIEKSELKAFKLDDNDGIAEYIGFNSNMINRVDYFLEDNHTIQLIELSNLKESAKECLSQIDIAVFNRAASISKAKATKNANAQVWQKLTDEFFKKWSGSIAVMERLYRKTHQPPDINPSYCLLIVCVNDMDIKMLDGFTQRLKGMIDAVQVIKTNELSNFLIIKL